MPEYDVSLLWDPEARVWIATSDSIPGLVLESDSMDALIERVRIASPEIMAANGIEEHDFTLHFHSDHLEQVCL